ncbi:MAG TPA: hypothetical protein PLW40_12270 [Syntrophales bacterium]|nr:hypothetical protein [Syntrophales bacterium]
MEMKAFFRKSSRSETEPLWRRMSWGAPIRVPVVFLALWLSAAPTTAAAQGWYWGSPVAPGYDRTAVVEMEGVALHVDMSPQRGGASLQMAAQGESVTVTLGPVWYLRRQDVDIKTGDQLTVKGAKTKTREGKVYLAAAVIKNLRTGRILTLRDEDGRPLWTSKKRFQKEEKREGTP